MPIYVAKDRGGQPKCVILAESYELAWAYFLGKGLEMYTIETVTEKDVENQLVVPLSE